jgi:UDP:flavonoid glycosyltransferase YjiC (YdhE family)
MKVLFIVFSPATGSFGSLTRVLALAREFAAKGHEVEFCATGHVKDLIEKKKFPVRAVPEPTLIGLPRVLSRILEKRAQNIRIPLRGSKTAGSVWFVYYLTGMLSERFLSRLVSAELTAIADFKPDLIVTELDPGAYLAARISGVPIVTTFAKIAAYGSGSRSWKRAKRVLSRVLRRYGAKPLAAPEDIMSGDGVLDIIPSIPALDGSLESANVVYVGNILEPVRDERLTFSAARGSRYVFVYSGTGSLPIGQLRKVLPSAFEGIADVQCLVAAETLEREERIGNVFFAPWIPAREILPQCDLVICHGGLNTITQSIEAGVPLLCFPGAIFERRYNAEMVMKNGAGMMGESSDFNPAWIRRQYERRHEFAPGVTRLRGDFAHYSGAPFAVDRIIAWKKSDR